ncbi:MAG: S-layer homology domain-containing protein [Candidatus Peregrinibacteria bacterium]|nr:S-layer homology domain-containing protein [Candidatus Peregrinibacteria bacterium]
MKKDRSYYFQHPIFTLLLVGFFTTSLYVGGMYSNLIYTSVVGFPQHAPFDGTAYPVRQIPDWSHIKSDKYKSAYDAFSEGELVEAPKYDPAQLSVSTDTLKWGNPADDKVRNAKITYSVPYLSTYLLDGKENTGSHPAVDIKVPEGTPVYSIMNGTVVKASGQSSGFGHHIVIQHNNVPTLNNSSEKVTLYSSYSHLKDVNVAVGDVVTKGQQIATSGKTGTATTPHVHFQLDNSEAPWHPFWPFTTKEATDAGLDFFTAINAGLGRESALATTINPLKYVNAYIDPNAVYSNSGATSSSAVTSSDKPATSSSDSAVATATSAVPVDGTSAVTETPVAVETQPVETPVAEETSAQPVQVETPVLTFEFEVNDTYTEGQNAQFKILLRDQNGNVYQDGMSGEAVVSSVRGNFIATSSIFTSLQFNNNGEFVNAMRNMKAGNDKLKLEFDGKTYYSKEFKILANKTGDLFSDVPAGSKYYEAVNYLANSKVIGGYGDGTFKPDNVVNRVEALKFILEAINKKLDTGHLPFKDTSSKEWYAKYLYTAYKAGVVNGYDDKTFRPTSTVNKAEFYKILFAGMGVDVGSSVGVSPYSDVKVGDWFAPYISYAKTLGVIEDGVKKLNPSGGMTRGEVAYAMYKLMLTMK